VIDMDQGVRIAAACSVLVCGLFVAMLFRHDTPREAAPSPDSDDRLVLRKHVEPQCPQPVTPGCVERPLPTARPAPAAPPAVEHAPTILTPMDTGEPPPELARDYPGQPAPTTAGRVATAGRNLRETRVRTHKVVDGDTLRLLAERYLGSAGEAMAIFEANRDALPSPEILPIGVELKIPPRRVPAASPRNFMPRQPPLVPVASEASETP
jgi:LysM repeat protein